MHPIFALWAHPRSMSTAIERIMRERGDLDCAHEPFMYDYYVHRRVDRMPHFDVDPEHPQSYADIRDMLLERAERAPVFIKDMSYYVVPHILADDAFRARLRDGFLVRRPRAAIASYARIDPDMSCEEIGIAAQWQHFQALARRPGPPPPVIRAEDVRAAPHAVIGALWQAWGLGDADHAFEWQSAPPADWEQVGGWHGAVSASSGIAPPPAGAEAREQAAFGDACAVFPHLRGYLDAHLSAYENLCKHALTLR